MESRYPGTDYIFEFVGDYPDEETDTWPCLCTFPFNNEAFGNKLGEWTVASLALLGAAVAISSNQPSKLERQEWNCDDHYYLPYCVPEWIRKEIKRVLNIE
jgi:hypothetical protein